MTHALRGLFPLVLLALGLVGSTAAHNALPPAAEDDLPVGIDLTIDYLRQLPIVGSEIIIERVLENGANYSRYIASYLSEGLKIYALMTIPFGPVPAGGFKAIVLNHGYIPPDQYVATESYVRHVDDLARSGFVVFMIDMRGHGDSEGEATGTYFSPGYTIDAVAAVRSLQMMNIIDPHGIGMWGHSMSGNVTLRAMLLTDAIQAGVIWAGAVYSYDDFAYYGIADLSFDHNPDLPIVRRRNEIFNAHGFPNTAVPFWRAVSLTHNIAHLQQPVQLHHAVDDDVVNIGYARGLADVLRASNKVFELHEYATGGHLLAPPTHELAMARTIAFFRRHL